VVVEVTMPEVPDMSGGFAYYVYTSMATGYDPMKAHGVLRARVSDGYILNVERLVDGAWEYDPDGLGDIRGITGATGVKRVSEAKLREIIKANTKTLDPATVLTP
jgi:hypothetical protein